jgi:hypothetical protein
MNTFLDGNINGTYYKAKFEYHSLVLKNNSFNIGDTLAGNIDFETEPFRYVKSNRRDHVSGPFITIIHNRDDLPQYFFHIP